jgi:hypothetical protein
LFIPEPADTDLEGKPKASLSPLLLVTGSLSKGEDANGFSSKKLEFSQPPSPGRVSEKLLNGSGFDTARDDEVTEEGDKAVDSLFSLTVIGATAVSSRDDSTAVDGLMLLFGTATLSVEMAFGD